MAVRPIDANAMLNELRPVSFETEHSAVLLSDVSKIMREWVKRQPTLTLPNEPRMINADKLAKRIAGHSNYHGDSILAAIYCAAEGKENNTPIRPIENPPNEPLTLEFDVVDTTTGKYPDWERIARDEAWAKGLVYCDMDGVAIREDGSLILLDECGNCVSCPPDRFEIRRPPDGDEDT